MYMYICGTSWTVCLLSRTTDLFKISLPSWVWMSCQRMINWLCPELVRSKDSSHNLSQWQRCSLAKRANLCHWMWVCVCVCVCTCTCTCTACTRWWCVWYQCPLILPLQATISGFKKIIDGGFLPHKSLLLLCTCTCVSCDEPLVRLESLTIAKNFILGWRDLPWLSEQANA